MTFRRTRLHVLQIQKSMPVGVRSGISLHCHTEHSRENLDFVPFYAGKMPLISYYFKREVKQYERRERRKVDFATAYWSPPLTPSKVFNDELTQINELGLKAFVSITDHDSIEANLQLNRLDEKIRTPISLEWTVPFGKGFFHCGIHNLPAGKAAEITTILKGHTDSTDPNSEGRLDELFEMLDDYKDVLIVLNHPHWDIEMIGQETHERLLVSFVRSHGRWLHAIEVNGFRTWSENKIAIELAESMGIPVVAGGDRHGCDPNTVINISQCESFEEFVDDVRNVRLNEILFMPEYRRPLFSRQLRAFAQILNEYPELGTRAKWMGRIYFDIGDESGLRSVTDLGMVTGPLWLRCAIRTLGVLGNPRLAVLFRFTHRRANCLPLNLDSSNFGLQGFENLAGKFTSESVL